MNQIDKSKLLEWLQEKDKELIKKIDKTKEPHEKVSLLSEQVAYLSIQVAVLIKKFDVTGVDWAVRTIPFTKKITGIKSTKPVITPIRKPIAFTKTIKRRKKTGGKV